MDMNDFDSISHLAKVWGTQCNFRLGFWQYANQSTTGWLTSAVPCNDGRHPGQANMSLGVWHHIQRGNHLVQPGSCVLGSKAAGGQLGQGSAPCEYFDYLAIDGTIYTAWGQVVAAQTSNFDSLVGTQVQLDTTCQGCTVAVYLDEAAFSAGVELGAQ
jgi:hypothetical protein